MNAKSRENFDEDQDMYMVLRYLPMDYLLAARRKNNNYTVKKSNNT